jgi:hypothetical protein
VVAVFLGEVDQEQVVQQTGMQVNPMAVEVGEALLLIQQQHKQVVQVLKE